MEFRNQESGFYSTLLFAERNLIKESHVIPGLRFISYFCLFDDTYGLATANLTMVFISIDRVIDATFVFRNSKFPVVAYFVFLHDRSWISPWIKSISNELDITCHVFASQLPGHCDVIANRLWRHQQNVKRASETRGWHAKILVFSVIYGFVMSCKK